VTKCSVLFHALLYVHISYKALMLMFMLIVNVIFFNYLNLYYGLENHIFVSTGLDLPHGLWMAELIVISFQSLKYCLPLLS
jgi:hypothetical protein